MQIQSRLHTPRQQRQIPASWYTHIGYTGYDRHAHNQGFTVIVLVLFITTLTVFIGTALARLGIMNARMGFNITQSNQSFYSAEAAIEDGMIRIKNMWPYSASESFVLNNASTTYTITDSETEPTHKLITAISNAHNRYRTLQALTEFTAFPATFAYVAYGKHNVHADTDGVYSPFLIGNVWSDNRLTLQQGAVIDGGVIAKEKLTLETGPGTAIFGDVQADKITVENSAGIYATTTASGNATAVTSITNNGFIEGAQTIDGVLVIGQLEFPVFDFQSYQAQANSAGTLFPSNEDFINYLESRHDAGLGRYILTEGVYYVSDKIKLKNLDYPDPVEVTGTLIADDKITIQVPYTHLSANNLPILAAKKKITITIDDAVADVPISLTGLIFSEDEIYLRHNHASGITIMGEVIGEEIHINENIRLFYDSSVLQTLGFDISATGNQQELLLSIYEIY